jgi:hypothetical protein
MAACTVPKPVDSGTASGRSDYGKAQHRVVGS